MTLAEIQKKVQDIDAGSGDDEGAHCAEDALYREFVQFIADHYTGDISEMAKEVLKTRDIKFSRWCA